jgi:hypothetical protein
MARHDNVQSAGPWWTGPRREITPRSREINARRRHHDIDRCQRQCNQQPRSGATVIKCVLLFGQYVYPRSRIRRTVFLSKMTIRCTVWWFITFTLYVNVHYDHLLYPNSKYCSWPCVHMIIEHFLRCMWHACRAPIKYSCRAIWIIKSVFNDCMHWVVSTRDSVLLR